jgi:epoxyqueuosine reductase
MPRTIRLDDRNDFRARSRCGRGSSEETVTESNADAALHVRESIRRRAFDGGFDAVGFADASGARAEAENLADYIADGRHGEMTWMATTADRRADPRALWPDVRTVISLGVNYGPAVDPLATLALRDRATISVYARGRDYHAVLGRRLKALARWLAEAHDCAVKVFVDTAPVMEKPLAQRAGLGWIGKHTNLVSRRFGSWLFLGEVFTTLEVPPDPPAVDHCGSCDRCLRACPTGALPEPYRIEPRRCLSYLTIEHKGAIAPDLAARAGNRVFGCDDCLAACPWNRFATPTPHAPLAPRAELMAPRLADLAQLTEPDFRDLFAGSTIKRTGRDRFLRNVRIAATNAKARERIAAADDDAMAGAAPEEPRRDRAR